jgi:hypothetical protein
MKKKKEHFILVHILTNEDGLNGLSEFLGSPVTVMVMVMAMVMVCLQSGDAGRFLILILGR